MEHKKLTSISPMRRHRPINCTVLQHPFPHHTGHNNREFDLAMQFDVRRKVEVLADTVTVYLTSGDVRG
jgi:hypothetical protein